MSDHYLKVVLKGNANILDFLRLSSQLETNDLVEETQIFLDAVIEIEDQALKPASLIQWRLKKKLQDTIKMLALLRKKRRGPLNVEENQHPYLEKKFSMTNCLKTNSKTQESPRIYVACCVPGKHSLELIGESPIIEGEVSSTM